MGYNVNCAIEALKEKNIEKALSLLDDKNRIFEEWTTDDLHSRYEERIENGDVFKRELTDEYAVEILNLCSRKMDCEVGINWNVIDFHTDSILN